MRSQLQSFSMIFFYTFLITYSSSFTSIRIIHSQTRSIIQNTAKSVKLFALSNNRDSRTLSEETVKKSEKQEEFITFEEVNFSTSNKIRKAGEINESREISPILSKDLNEFSASSEIKNFFNFPPYIPILALTFSVTCLSALDRVAMSVAVLPLSQELQLNEATKGLISSALSAGYGLAIIPCGLLIANISPKLAMGFGVFLWSTATIFTPLSVEYQGLNALLLVRGMVGAAESVVLPAVQKLLYNWVPNDRRSVATAGVFAGFSLGTILAYLLSPYVIDYMEGWRGLFYVYGAVGLIWLVPWFTFARDDPSDATAVDIPNKVKADQSPLDVIKSAPWKTIFTSPAILAITLAHACNNWGLYNNLSWTPTFYAEQYGLNVRDSAFLSILPSAAGAITGILAGYAADELFQKFQEKDPSFDRTNIRKLFQGMAHLGPCLCFFLLSREIPADPAQAQLLLTGSTAMQAFISAGYGPACQEKAGAKWGGLLYSMTSLPGIMFGTFGVYVTGRILDATGNDWSVPFSINSFIFLVGALSFIFLYDGKKELD